GIRDFHVTGVQTCALPISFKDQPFFLGTGEFGCEVFADNLFVDPGEQFHTFHLGEVLKMAMICLSLIVAGEKPKVQEKVSAHEEIGRASCRERVYKWEVPW